MIVGWNYTLRKADSMSFLALNIGSFFRESPKTETFCSYLSKIFCTEGKLINYCCRDSLAESVGFYMCLLRVLPSKSSTSLLKLGTQSCLGRFGKILFLFLRMDADIF